MTAPIASGWSGCRVGLAPTGKRRLARRTQPSQIAIRSTGLSSHLMLVADGIQLGSRQISACFQELFRHFAAFSAIEIATEFLFVGMATTTKEFILCSSAIVVHQNPT
jgi:hypothetical protein